MALGSVLHTALSGLSAAETAVQVLGNNLANSQTAGFKASRPVFSTRPPQTASPGAARSGGSNPLQVGRGTLVGGVVEMPNSDAGNDLVALFRMAVMYRIESTVLRPTERVYEDLAGLPRPK